VVYGGEHAELCNAHPLAIGGYARVSTAHQSLEAQHVGYDRLCHC